MRAVTLLLGLVLFANAGARAADDERSLLVNGDFETGDLTGWTVVEGIPVASDKPKAKDWPGPFEGTHYFYGHRSKRGVVEQRVTVGERARGGAAVLSGMFRGNGRGNDRAIATLSALDADGRPVAHATTPAISNKAWRPETIEIALPESTRELVVRLVAERIDGRAADGCADALTLVVLPSLGSLREPKSDVPLSELSLAALGRLAETSTNERLARGAAFALSGRGDPGWTKLSAAVRRRLKDDTVSLAMQLLTQLATGDEPGRRTQLRLLYGQAKNDDVRGAILAALARFYPADADWMHTRLKDSDLVTPEVLLELEARGLPTPEFERFLDVARIADVANDILRRRGQAASPAALATLARELALEANSTASWRAILDRWIPEPDWGVVSALPPLLADKDERVRTGAHLLLLGVSGRTLIPDVDVWESWVAANQAGYVVPVFSSPGHVEAATLRAVRWLHRTLATDGYIVRDTGSYKRGATALAVYALLSCDVPRDDPVIQRMLSEVILPPALGVKTYELGVLAMLLAKLDPVEHRQKLQEIANVLVAGQHAEGGWSYECYSTTSGKKLRRRDMSNTQYAVLGLRACRRAGIAIPRDAWEHAATRIRARRWNTNSRGLAGWAYRRGQQPSFGMTAAGVGSLAICLEALHGETAAATIAGDADLQKGLAHLGAYVLDYRGMGNVSIYRYHALERACALTAARSFSGVDWFTAGATDLLASQEDDGQWSDPEVSPRRRLGGYGAGVETAYALLFLRQATTPVDADVARGEVTVRGLGPAQHQAPGSDLPAHSFVASWRFADRIVPWNDSSKFVDVTDDMLRAVAHSALRAPLRRSKEEYIQLVHHLAGRCNHVAGYAARRVTCASPTRVTLRYGSNDSIRAWVDGDLVLQELAIRSSAADQGEATFEFPAGESTLLIELSSEATWWSMYVRFESADGKELRLTDEGRLEPFVPAEK